MFENLFFFNVLYLREARGMQKFDHQVLLKDTFMILEIATFRELSLF